MSDRISADTCWMFLVRHGATEQNLAQPTVLQGSGIDGPLAVIGREQAAMTARFLSRYRFDAAYASPMRRAQETAEIIVAPHGLPITPVSQIVEADVGRWLGRDWDSIAAQEPEAYRRHLEDPSVHPYPEGESATDVHNRAVPALVHLMQKNLGRRILVVAHNIVNRVMVAHLHHIPLRHMRAIHQDNCGINLIRLRGAETELVTANATFHLQPEVKTSTQM